MLNHRLLPAFGARRLDRITRSMALGWFEAGSRTAPAAANAAPGARHPPQSQQKADALPLPRGDCPPSPRPRPVCAGDGLAAQQADIIRLLLLTGSRRGEIVYLRREEVRDDQLKLGDSKTGPRTVLLNAPAREIVARRMRQGNGTWLFPSVKDPSRPSSREPWLWHRVRR